MFVKVTQIGMDGERWDSPLIARYNITHIRSYCEFEGLTLFKVYCGDYSSEVYIKETPEELDLLIERASEKVMQVLYGKDSTRAK